MKLEHDLEFVLHRLDWMEAERIWPNGLRYLWTDAFGVVLLASLFDETNIEAYLVKAKKVVVDVYRVLGRERGIRIGQAADRDGQYFHYLAMWMYALSVMARFDPEYKNLGVQLVKQVHSHFYVPGQGVIWKMREDLSGPYPGFGFGALDALDGYISYRCLCEEELADEISDMKSLVDRELPNLYITQDLGLGMMLWMTHFFPEEDWARIQLRRCLDTLDRMWNEQGYFCREPHRPEIKFAFTNYGVSIGLQAVSKMPDRVESLNDFFANYRSNDRYDRDAITHVMGCSSHFPGRFIQSQSLKSQVFKSKR